MEEKEGVTLEKRVENLEAVVARLTRESERRDKYGGENPALFTNLFQRVEVLEGRFSRFDVSKVLLRIEEVFNRVVVVEEDFAELQERFDSFRKRVFRLEANEQTGKGGPYGRADD